MEQAAAKLTHNEENRQNDEAAASAAKQIPTVPSVKSPITAAMKKCLALAKEVGLEGVVQENIQEINTESFKDTQATPEKTRYA